MAVNALSGSVWKSLVSFSIPFVISYFLQTLYGMADLVIIGQFEGPASITAVAVGSQIMHMVTVVLVGLSMGTTIAIARAVGRSREGELHHRADAAHFWYPFCGPCRVLD